MDAAFMLLLLSGGRAYCLLAVALCCLDVLQCLQAVGQYSLAAFTCEM